MGIIMSETFGGYVAIVLTPESHNLLRAIAVHPEVRSHHCTVYFRPTEKELAQFQDRLGTEMTLEVVEVAEDEKGQVAVLKDHGLLSNRTPHVTVSCAEGVEPVYSNQLLQAGPRAPFKVTLVGTLELVRF